jgi:hypothetical protein
MSCTVCDRSDVSSRLPKKTSGAEIYSFYTEIRSKARMLMKVL